MQGTVKKVIQQRGFGFIESDDFEDDIFFHYSQLQGIELSELPLGASVEFELEDTPKGPQAVNISVITE